MERPSEVDIGLTASIDEAKEEEEGDRDRPGEVLDERDRQRQERRSHEHDRRHRKAICVRESVCSAKSSDCGDDGDAEKIVDGGKEDLALVGRRRVSGRIVSGQPKSRDVSVSEGGLTSSGSGGRPRS